MKITILIITTFLIQVSAATKAQNITLNEKNTPLEKIIKLIRTQTGYDFFGNTSLIREANPVTINVKRASISEVLKICFANQQLDYSIEEKTIIVMPIASIQEAMNNQKILTITGTVMAEDGEVPLANATVTAVGTNLKVYTDKDGGFSIKIPESVKVLRFNYIGYDQKDIKIDGGTKKVTVRMVVKNNALDEIVVRTGVYKRPVENFTGSAKTITAEELKRVSSSNILAAIGILDPSFRLPEDINVGSDPNHLPDIELRGQNNFPDKNPLADKTVNNPASLKNVFGDKPNAPLFVLDGFQVSMQRIFDLDMNRVERITVLKDAAATSIYGSRASNGVIVIDTRQPKEGAITITYRGGVTVTAPDLSSYDLLNAKEKLAFEKEVGYYKDDGTWPYLQTVRDEEYNERLKDVTRGVDTYWLNKPLRTGFGNSHSLYFEGGDQVIRYGVNLSSDKDVAVMKGSGRDRVSGGVTLNYRTSNLLFGNDLSINNVKGINSPYGSFGDYTKLNQYWSPYDENGQFARFLGQQRRNSGGGPMFSNYANPLYNATLPSKDFNESLGFINNFKFEWSVLKWIRIIGGFGINHSKTSSDNYLSARNTAFESLPITERGSYTKTSGKTNLLDANLGFDIRKAWNKNLILFTGGVNATEGKEETYSTSAIGFPNEKVAEIIFASKYDASKIKPIGSQGISRLISGRMNGNYSYDNKYLLDVSVSLDASSQFGTQNSIAPFWSVGAGWNMHRERFLEDAKFINFLKLRGSVGTTGDQNFDPYMALSTYSYFSDQFYLNQLSAYLMGYGNTALGWQKSLKRSGGIDGTFWKNRISFSADFYYNTTNALILDISTPPSLGFGSYKENAGALKNIGWQSSLNVNLIQNTKDNIFWRVGLSAYSNKNTITKISNSLKKLNERSNKEDQDLTNPDRNKPKSYYQEGQSLSAIFAVRSLGIDPSNGQEMFLDRNNNATYVWNSLDKVAVGDSRPKVSGTVSTGFDYKGFGFNIYLSYRLGADVYNQTLVDRIENADITYNVDRRVATERWKKPGDHTFFKGIIGSRDGKPVVETTLPTSRFVQKEYIIEASNLSFTYQFPESLSWLKHARLSNARLELYVANPFQVSSIKRERGLDYPFARSFTINLSTSIF